MKYLVTAYASTYGEFEAESAEEAERMGERELRLPTFWDNIEVEELEENMEYLENEDKEVDCEDEIEQNGGWPLSWPVCWDQFVDDED